MHDVLEGAVELRNCPEGFKFMKDETCRTSSDLYVLCGAENNATLFYVERRVTVLNTAPARAISSRREGRKIWVDEYRSQIEVSRSSEFEILKSKMDGIL